MSSRKRFFSCRRKRYASAQLRARFIAREAIRIVVREEIIAALRDPLFREQMRASMRDAFQEIIDQPQRLAMLGDPLRGALALPPAPTRGKA